MTREEFKKEINKRSKSKLKANCIVRHKSEFNGEDLKLLGFVASEQLMICYPNVDLSKKQDVLDYTESHENMFVMPDENAVIDFDRDEKGKIIKNGKEIKEGKLYQNGVLIENGKRIAYSYFRCENINIISFSQQLKKKLNNGNRTKANV